MIPIRSPLVAYFIVFVASACTLILELVAGRLLAPYIGVSLYTWTSIIGVVLAGISLGNYLGGRVADRYPSQRTLGVILLASGLSSFLILVLATAAPGLLTPQVLPLVPRIVVLTTLLFFLPSVVLGMVSPVVVKLTLANLTEAGSIVGKIYAFSTLGSIVGTFLTGFVLIASLGTRTIVLGVAVALVLMALLFGGVSRRAPGALALLLLCLGTAGFTVGRGDLTSICTRETNYFCIRTYDTEINGRVLRAMVLDHLVHSFSNLADPRDLEYGYLRLYAEITRVIAREKDGTFSTLSIGGGGYTYPRYLEAVYPQAEIMVVEIDPGVTETAYRELGLPANSRVISRNEDARIAVDDLHASGRKFDMIFGDAFNDLSIPYHLTTLEFNRKVGDLLAPDGYYLANIIDNMDRGMFMRSYVHTLQQIFPYVYVISEGRAWETRGLSTYIVAARWQPLDLSIIERAAEVEGQAPIASVMPAEAMAAWLAERPPLLLTDEHAPVDNLLAPIFAERGI